MGDRGLSKRQRRRLVWVNVLLVAGFCAWYFGPTALFMWDSRYVELKIPAVKKVPVELTDLSVSSASGLKLSYFGYEFEVPWDDLDEARTRQVGKVQLIGFRSGNVIWFSRMAPKEFVETILSGTEIEREKLRKLYGDDALESDYALKRLILEGTPEQISLMTPRREAARRTMLLVMKGAVISIGGESGIFRVSNERLQGFQFGDPLRRPKTMSVEMFGEDGGLRFIFARNVAGPGPGIMQAEMNRVMQTARKIPTEGLRAEEKKPEPRPERIPLPLRY